MYKADHSGHRARMKKKLLEQGMDVFEQHEVLEILLYSAVPQRNTNDMAKNLIDKFGSISAVFDASMEALRSAGLSEHQALLLKMLPDITRLYLSDKHDNGDKVFDYSQMPSYILDRFIGNETAENVLLVLLDKKGKIVFSGMIENGDLGSANISIRKIVGHAINYSAGSAVLAHNHPSGLALPSKQDLYVTRDIKNALESVGVVLLDHYIVADHDCVSLAESGLI